MTVNFNKSATFVKSNMVNMKWQAERFITQKGFFLHAAVIEYKHPETGKTTGVAFTSGGNAIVFSDEVKGLKDGRQVMRLAKEIADENVDIVNEGGFPESFLTDFEEAYAIYENGNRVSTFSEEGFAPYFTQEDLEDIEARLDDLKTFDEQIEVD